MSNSTLDHAFFYNSENGDRLYDADSFSEWLRKFFTTGVFTGDLQVTATTGMGIQVASGYCNVNGKVKMWDTPTSFTLDTADDINPRIDRICIQRNDTNRDITLIVKTGTPAASPSGTSLQRSDGIYELCLAEVTVGAGAVSVTQANIADKRTDSDLCGIVTGTVEEIDFTQITAQWQAYYSEFIENEMADYTEWTTEQKAAFNEWFSTIQGILGEDEAANLLSMIQSNDSDISALQGRMSTAESEIDTLQTNISTAESDIDTLQSKMTTAEGDIDTLQSQMSTANSNINTLKTMGYVKTVNATINAASQNVGLGGTYTSADYFVTWGMGTGITSAQIKAMGKAQPVMTSISGTNAVFSCKGGAPSTGFPISIVVFKV